MYDHPEIIIHLVIFCVFSTVGQLFIFYTVKKPLLVTLTRELLPYFKYFVIYSLLLLAASIKMYLLITLTQLEYFDENIYLLVTLTQQNTHRKAIYSLLLLNINIFIQK